MIPRRRLTPSPPATRHQQTRGEVRDSAPARPPRGCRLAAARLRQALHRASTALCEQAARPQRLLPPAAPSVSLTHRSPRPRRCPPPVAAQGSGGQGAPSPGTASDPPEPPAAQQGELFSWPFFQPQPAGGSSPPKPSSVDGCFDRPPGSTSSVSSLPPGTSRKINSSDFGLAVSHDGSGAAGSAWRAPRPSVTIESTVSSRLSDVRLTSVIVAAADANPALNMEEVRSGRIHAPCVCRAHAACLTYCYCRLPSHPPRDDA